MRKHKLLALMLVLVMAVSIALTGCGGGTTPADNSTTAQPQQTEAKIDADQTLNIVGYDFKSLDTVAESDAESFTTMLNVFETLYRETEKGQVPAGATGVKVSSDGLVYTFTLRDAKWSDGQPVTAQQYVYAWKRLINPDNAYDYGTYLNMVKNVAEYRDGNAKIDDVGIKALDDKTLEVTLAHPTPYFINLMSFSILAPQREDLVKSLGDQYGQAWDKMVYNGPFVVSNYQKGSSIEYKKNPNYWDAANVKLEKAVCPIIQEQATLIQLFQAKQLDQTGASGDYIKQLDAGKDAGGYDHIQGFDGGTYYGIFNMKNPVLANLKVRQAIIAAFDKQAFLDTVYKRFVPSYGIVAPKILLGNDEFRSKAGEPQKDLINSIKDPKALMAEGLKEVGINDPSQFKVKLLYGQQTSTSSASAQFVQNQLESKLGIKAEIQFSVDSPAYFTAREEGQFDICLGGWGPDYNDVSTYFGLWTTNDANNNGKYSNKEFDQLVADGAKELDNAKRFEMYKKAEKILVADDPAIFTTFYSDYQTFRYKWVKGLYLPMFGGYYALKDAYIQGRE